MRFALALVVSLIAASSSPAAPGSPAVFQRISPKAYAYVPASITAPAPLIVLLHGAGGNARSFLSQFKRDADERHVVLLAVQSDGRTWAQRKPSNNEMDVINIKAAIAALPVSVDANQVTVMGFSDGASYALSVGMAYPGLFKTIIAFSPGYAFAPSTLHIDQRIFIAHSRRDPVLPAENTRRMVEGLERAGFVPEVHWFNGGHEIDPELKKAAFDFAAEPIQTPR